jgi:hypothetical protein
LRDSASIFSCWVRIPKPIGSCGKAFDYYLTAVACRWDRIQAPKQAGFNINPEFCIFFYIFQRNCPHRTGN